LEGLYFFQLYSLVLGITLGHVYTEEAVPT
jgi:hypothetical protein